MRPSTFIATALVFFSLMGAQPAAAGPYYDLRLWASSATLKLGGNLTVENPASTGTATITLKGNGGVVTATSFVGALTGNASSSTYATTTSSDTYWNNGTSSAVTAVGWGNHALGGYANLVAVGTATGTLRTDLTALALSTGPLVRYTEWDLAYSSSAYWNAKQAAGNYITSLTGGVTASGPGAAAATVVTNANLTGPITSVGNATTIVGPVPVSTIDLSTVTTAIGLTVLKAGDTMTGLLALSSTTNTGNSSQTGPATFTSSVTVVGTMTATNVIGNGSGLTSLNGNAIAAGATVSSLTVTGASSLNMYSLGSSSITINTATYDIPVSTGKPYWFINLSSSTTLSFSNVVAGMDLTFAIKQSSNSKTITWPTSTPNIRWPASGNTLSTTTLKIDMVNIACPFVATECFGALGPTGY